jgi:hypothetical protein
MIVACRTKNPGEKCGSEVPAAAGIFGIDYLQFRFVGGPNAIGVPLRDDPLWPGECKMIGRSAEIMRPLTSG